ncbi:MAG: hypothetical protein CMF26_00240 [Kiloniella sp.]|nr:hypothetical protein [Kiloniella sp.]
MLKYWTALVLMKIEGLRPAFNRHWVAVLEGWIAPTSLQPRFARRSAATRTSAQSDCDVMAPTGEG